MTSVSALKAIVRSGRAVLVEDRVDYPDGTELTLEVTSPELDELEPGERERLHASLRRGLAQANAGQGRPVDDFLADLKEP